MTTTTTKEFKHFTQTENNISCEVDKLSNASTSRKCQYTHTTTPYFNKIQNKKYGFGVTEQTINADKSILFAFKTIEDLSLKLNAFDKKQKVYNFGLNINDLNRDLKVLEVETEITAKADINKENINSDLIAYITTDRKLRLSFKKIESNLIKSVSLKLNTKAYKVKMQIITDNINYVMQQETLNELKANVPNF